MAGYQRQSAADIVPTAVVRAAPINNELNALRDAFLLAGGHRHDGSATEGNYVTLIADSDALNKVVVDTANNRVGVFVEVAAATVEQVRVQDGAIVPVTDNDINLGTSALEFKDLFIDGTANIDSLVADTADINAGTIDNTVIGATTPVAATVTTLAVNTSAVIASADINAGTVDATIIGATTPAAATVTSLIVNTTATIASADINAGTIDGTVIGASAAQAITGTTITASTGFSGPLSGAVTGNTAGVHTGAVSGNVTGDLSGNVTASTGTSTFNDVTINGGLNMNAGTAATITNLTLPTNSGDAATKGYVDTAAALKLNLSGGTMTGVIAMGTNKITGLDTPTANADAATKLYVDTSISNLVASAPGTLDTLNELADALGDDPSFATTVATSIATKLPLAGGTMTGAIAMGTSKITGMGDPTLAQDAATKAYVDTADALRLLKTGGTMSGAIAMGTSKITGVGDPTANQDAATKAYVDTADSAKLSLTGGTMSGAIAMGTSKITGMGEPTLAQDAATKNYIDVLFGSTTTAAASAAAAAVSAGNAATSASNASTSASAASGSATTASNAATAAAASYDSFDDRYLGPKASSPTVDNDGAALLTGALYFDTAANEMRVYTGSIWKATGSAVNGTSERYVYTATASQTTFAVAYDVGFVDVYLNGVKQVVSVDFTATSGVNIVLTTGATAGDLVDIVAYSAFLLANTYTQTAADARFAQVANNLSDLASAATARTNLGLAIGTNVQAYDADLTTLGAGGSGARSFLGLAIGTDVQAYDADLTTVGAGGVGARSFLGLAIGTDVQAYNANTAVTNAAQTFTATQTFSGTSSAKAIVLNDAAEVATVSATAATGTIAYDITTQSVLYYTSNASANWTVNFRGSSGTSLNTLMATGESMTVAFLVTQGATAYYNSAVQVDGTTSGVTTRWLGGAPTAGNASGIDSYRYLIIKTGSATFTVLASNTQFKA